MNKSKMSRAELQRSLELARSDIRKLTLISTVLAQGVQYLFKDNATLGPLMTVAKSTTRTFPDGTVHGCFGRPISDFPIPTLDNLFKLDLYEQRVDLEVI
jgi:hypothetical protein